MNAIVRDITLDDKYVRLHGEVYLTGIQGLVRLLLDRGRLDRAHGLRTGGFVSGYRGSPLGGFDQQLAAARRHLEALEITVQPGLNEDLAATAVWGSQKLGTTAPTDFDGAFGLWYGKGPGVDRTGDVFKHANQSGTAPNGGVLAVAGDDHLAKSSTLGHQSEYAFVDAEMPVLNPADLQDLIDLGQHGYEMSRFSGLWTAMIALADTMDSSGIVRVDPERLSFVRPEADPRQGLELNRVVALKGRLELERTLREIRLPAAKLYVRANRLDRVRFGASPFGAERPRLGIVAAGKAFRDAMQTLKLAGIDERHAREIGLAVYQVAMPWPLEPEGISEFAQGLERLLVIEHKRGLIEPQIKDLAYHWPADRRPQVFGKRDPQGRPLLPDVADLGTAEIAAALDAFLPADAHDQAFSALLGRIRDSRDFAVANAADAARSAYFCAGCPHNTSTNLPEGSLAMAGIGCHVMTEIAGRTTEGTSAMGGEGIMWAGAHPFSKSRHVFANLGDGTYFHSGILAIRQALAVELPITYKILYNDAVAMTGGQAVDGTLTVPALTRQLEAEGVKRMVLVSEHPEHYADARDLAPGLKVEHRDELPRIQREVAEYPGVSVIVYDQTCATEKRRRRKRGTYAASSQRVFVNDRVCEDCGDCSVQSNCIAVEPLATPFGRKRLINQSSCNQDLSCAKGFCPSFVWVEGAEIRKASARVDVMAVAARIPALNLSPVGRGRTEGPGEGEPHRSRMFPTSTPETANSGTPEFAGRQPSGRRTLTGEVGTPSPDDARASSTSPHRGEVGRGPAVAPLTGTLNILLTGIGGMGVTTTAAVLAMAAHLDGLNVLTLDMTGLAQKGGPVTSHVRLGPGGQPIEGPRVPLGNLDVLLAGDLLTAAQGEGLSLMSRAATRAVANRHVAPTAEFVMQQRQSFEAARLSRTVSDAVRAYAEADFSRAAERLLGDAIFANMMMVGFAQQRGLLPLTLGALEQAIRLNGAAAESNIQALHAGRVLAVDPAALGLGEAHAQPSGEGSQRTLDERAAFLADELARYQSRRYAARFTDFLRQVRAADERAAPQGGLALTRAVAENLYKLMAYKDEYEVARLYSEPAFREKLEAQFSGWKTIGVSLAPPLLSRLDPATGRPRKRRFGPWIFQAFRVLAGLRTLRATPLDPFGYTAERRAERALIGEYRADVERLLSELDPARYALALEIARLPDLVRGYGPIKERNLERHRAEREALLARWTIPEAMKVLQAAE